MDNQTLQSLLPLAEMALASKEYVFYVEYVHRGRWARARHLEYICNEIQRFIETNTGHAIDILVLQMPPQHGKLVTDNTPVLTRNGWKNHGDLVVGDEVISNNGNFVKVTHIHPKHYADLMVTFSNGEQIKCHENHEWIVYDRAIKETRTLETKEIKNRRLFCGNEGKRGCHYTFQLPLNDVVNGENMDLSVKPYTFGAWLGDGSNQKPCITGAREDYAIIESVVNDGYEISSSHIHKDTGVLSTYFKGLRTDLRKLGLCHCTKRIEKRIPSMYLTASINQRLDLLAGLLDTDGYLYEKTKRYCFTTSDELLRDDFISLIATFGWRCSVYRTEPSISSSGIVGKKPYWQLCFNPTLHIPCRLERKQLHKFSKQRRVAITNIEKIPSETGNCITVEGGIYLVGRKLIPTHNSMTITETLPSWYLGRNPDNRVILASYNDDTAERFTRRNKEKIKECGQDIFNIKISNDIDRATEFEIAGRQGRMISRGIMSGITSNPANLVIIDDPVKNRQEADSETYRMRQWEEWVNTIKTRLAANAKIILIMTRWHEDDLAGRIIANEKNVTVINLPCEAEENDPLGRKVGEALFPEIGKDNIWLEEFKHGYKTAEGSRAWDALFQGRPSSMEGNLVKRDWWRYYENLPEIINILMSVDATFKDKDDSDFVAIQVWGKRQAEVYLIDAIKAHLDFPGTLRAVLEMKRKHPKCRQVLIEDKANGSAAIQMLQKKIPGVIPVNPKGGKVARVNAISPAIESGNVYLPKNAAFTVDFVNEFSAFPNGKNDDQVDAASQALNRLLYNTAALPRIPGEEPFPDRSSRHRKTQCIIGGKVNVRGLF